MSTALNATFKISRRMNGSGAFSEYLTSNMRLRQIAERVSWPLCLAIALAFVLLHQWYFSAGYLTFGDFPVSRSSALLPGAFHLWAFSADLGRPDPSDWWHGAFLGTVFHFGIAEGLADRIVWLYFSAPLLIGGFYVLAKLLTQDKTAAGVAALVGFLNVDFLVRVLGGHNTAPMAIALGPWVLVGVLQGVRTGRAGWFGFIVVATGIATAYDARWIFPVFAIAVVLALTSFAKNSPYNPKARFFAIAACALGLVLPNLPWLVASVSTGAAFAPVPPASYANPIWVQRLSLATFWDAFAIWNPTFGSDFDRGPFVVAHMPWWGGMFAATIVVSVIVSRLRLALLFFVLYIIGVFLYKGSQPPAGAAYIWLFQHAPLFDLYREPLKFGAAASLCASIVIAYGVAALRGRTAARVAFIVSVCGVVVSLAAPAFYKPGLLVARAPNPAYAMVQRIVASDATFSRVLWLPMRSRWIAGTALHPVADGASLGNLDWAAFRSPVGLGDDGTTYVYSPLFGQLLRWSGFRYVVVDCGAEVEETFRSDSFSCLHFERALNRDHAFAHVATLGPASIFRLIGAAAPALWSSRDARLAIGTPLSLNAGALTGAFADLEPVVIGAHGADPKWFERQELFDSAAAAQRVLGPQHSERIVAADSIDFGPNRGDAIIDRRPLSGNSMAPIVVVGYGLSSIAYDGTVAGSRLQTARPLGELPRATILDASEENTRWPGRMRTWGFETPASAIPMYEYPVLRIVADRSSGSAELLPLFELRDEKTGVRYELFGSPFKQSDAPRAEFDIRDWLFRTVVDNRRYDAELGANDGFDRLDLVRVRLVQLDTQPLRQRFSLAVRARTPTEGYPLRSVRRFAAGQFSCACAKLALPARTRFTLGVFRTLGSNSVRGVVAIHARSGSFTGIISQETPGTIRGIATVGNRPFLLQRKEITAIEPAPDVALVDMHVTSPAAGVLFIQGEIDPRVTVQLLLKGRSASGVGWIAKDVPYPSWGKEERPFHVREDLAAVGRAGYGEVTDVFLLLKYRFPPDKLPTIMQVSDAAVVADVSGTSPRPILTIAHGAVSTNLAAGSVPLAARFSSMRSGSNAIARLEVVPSVDTSFQDDSGNKWLVFSQRFDPGWVLIDGHGARVDALDLRAYGTLNAWHVPAGLHARYRIVYVPDVPARVGGAIALAATLGCAALAFTLLPLAAGKHPGQSERQT